MEFDHDNRHSQWPMAQRLPTVEEYRHVEFVKSVVASGFVVFVYSGAKVHWVVPTLIEWLHVMDTVVGNWYTMQLLERPARMPKGPWDFYSFWKNGVMMMTILLLDLWPSRMGGVYH